MNPFTHPRRVTLAPALALACLLLPAAGRATGDSLGDCLFRVAEDAPALIERRPAQSQAPGSVLAGMDWFAQSAGEHGGWDLVQALLLPGVDQAQHGQWLKAVVFVGVETGLLLTSQALRAKGDELDDDFKAFANEHWSYDRYVDWRRHPGEFALEEGWLDRNISEADLANAATQAEIDALFAAIGDDEFNPTGGEGSHILPGRYLEGYAEGQNGAWDHFALARTQQFYEMIGKYAQFQRGWELYGADGGWEFVAQQPWHFQEFCSQSRTYMSMRSESNDKLIAADRLMGLVVLNHVASFLDVLIQYRREALPLHVQSVSLETGHGRQPGLGLTWSF